MIETFSENYPNYFVVFYKKKSFFSFWKRLNEVFYLAPISHIKPSVDQPIFFHSILEAKRFIKNNFKSDDDILKHEIKNNNKYKKALKDYESRSKIQREYL